ncbi:MAG: YciI family protein [Chloroflexi bacterium]|nr:YciI family protein [Chloroflexota bacterium]
MKYVLLICGDEAAGTKMTQEEGAKMMAAYGAYTKELVASGAMQGGEALMPSTTATTVRVRGGKISTTDGPFAETKERLGGYYVVDVKDLDEAIKWAAKIPGAAFGSIEVRPVMDTTGM